MIRIRLTLRHGSIRAILLTFHDSSNSPAAPQQRRRRRSSSSFVVVVRRRVVVFVVVVVVGGGGGGGGVVVAVVRRFALLCSALLYSPLLCSALSRLVARGTTWQTVSVAGRRSFWGSVDCAPSYNSPIVVAINGVLEPGDRGFAISVARQKRPKRTDGHSSNKDDYARYSSHTPQDAVVRCH